jgi:hypothetical protein
MRTILADRLEVNGPLIGNAALAEICSPGEGKAFPCGRVSVSADPICGDTPQRPQSESADRSP